MGYMVSEHAIIRWLERIEGLDMKKVQAEATIVTGLKQLSDHNILAYMKRYHRLNIKALCAKIAPPEVRGMIRRGVTEIPIKNRRFRLKIIDGVIATVSVASK